MMSSLRVLLATAFALQAAPAFAQQPAAPKGTLERITVHGRALEGNLEGDSPDRPVVVYLPPSYATDSTRRYPVLYFLHGYTATAEAYVKSLAIPDSIDRAVAAGAREMIVVIPDAFTKYSGSMFSNSPTTGDWETFIAQDLTRFIDTRYRTIASREGRGLAGHSMGGYGTMRIGMKQPSAFAALYAMSSCCLMNDPAARGAGPGPRGDAAPGRSDAAARGAGAGAGRADGRGAGAGRGGGMANALSAQAAAWAPNAQDTAVLRSPHEGRRDPAAHCRKVDRELAAGDGRSVRARAQIHAGDRTRRRQSGPVRRYRTLSSPSR